MKRMKWTTEKPDKPCLFICRTKIKDKWDYTLFILEFVGFDDSRYLGWFDNNYDEYGALEELTADEYLIIE